MKRLLLLAATLTFVASAAFAQVPKRVLVEEFTSSTCPPCASTDPIMEQFEAANQDRITVLKWHVNWPSPGNDPYYTAFPGSVARSTKYYANNYAPHVFFNGTIDDGLGSSPDWVAKLEGYVDDAAAQTSPYDIAISQEITADSFIVNITVDTKGTAPDDASIRLGVVVAERFAYFKGTNGAPSHTSIVRTVLPSLTGGTTAMAGSLSTNADKPPTSGSKTYRYAVKLNTKWNKDQLMAAAFIQSVDTKEVYQSNNTVPYITIEREGTGLVHFGEEEVKFTIKNNSKTSQTLTLTSGSTAPATWGLKLNGADAPITLAPNESKVVTMSTTLTEPLGIADVWIAAKTADNIGAAGAAASGFGVGAKDLIVNATGLAESKFAFATKLLGDEGYKPMVIDYVSFYNNFPADQWGNFRTIYYAAGAGLGGFQFLDYMSTAINYIGNGGNFLLSTTAIPGAYYKAYLDQGNDAFVTALADAFNIDQRDNTTTGGWASLMGIPGDPIGNGISTTIAGITTDQPLHPLDGNSQSIFSNENFDTVGVRYATPLGGKSVILGFGLENFATARATDRDLILKRIMDWFAGTAGVKTSDKATSFSLEQNFPNPFNPTTAISYSIIESAPVTLTIQDMMGREVARPVDFQMHTPGTYKVDFDASKLTSGTYVYTLSSGNNRLEKKMILSK